MARGQANNRQKDIARVLREKFARPRVAPQGIKVSGCSATKHQAQPERKS